MLNKLGQTLVMRGHRVEENSFDDSQLKLSGAVLKILQVSLLPMELLKYLLDCN